MAAYFISYSRTDTETAVWFANQLRAAGLSVWFDQVDIKPSDRWDRTIEAALQDCLGLVLILSPRSAASENVLDEISVAMDAHKPVIPVMIETCQPPLRISRVQWIDARTDRYQALERCKTTLSGAMDQPSPQAPEAPQHLRFELTEPQSESLKRLLMSHLGPMAPHVVAHEARSADSFANLVTRLAERIPDQTARTAFGFAAQMANLLPPSPG
jgi:hypothetical protein